MSAQALLWTRLGGVIWTVDVLTAATFPHRVLSRLPHSCMLIEPSPDQHTCNVTSVCTHTTSLWPRAVCLSVHWSHIAYCFHGHKYYDYLSTGKPYQEDIFSRLKYTAFDITTCVNSPRHANELPDWSAHETAAVEVRCGSQQLKIVPNF